MIEKTPSRFDEQTYECVYVLQEDHSHRLKIGYSSRGVLKRAEAISRGMPSTAFPILELPAGRSDETDLLRLVQKEQICGEWFRPTARAFAEIFGFADGLASYIAEPIAALAGPGAISDDDIELLALMVSRGEVMLWEAVVIARLFPKGEHMAIKVARKGGNGLARELVEARPHRVGDYLRHKVVGGGTGHLFAPRPHRVKLEGFLRAQGRYESDRKVAAKFGYSPSHVGAIRREVESGCS